MKIDELIKELEQVKEEHGNLEVRKKDRNTRTEFFKRFEPFVAQNKEYTTIQDREIDEMEKFLAL